MMSRQRLLGIAAAVIIGLTNFPQSASLATTELVVDDDVDRPNPAEIDGVHPRWQVIDPQEVVTSGARVYGSISLEEALERSGLRLSRDGTALRLGQTDAHSVIAIPVESSSNPTPTERRVLVLLSSAAESFPILMDFGVEGRGLRAQALGTSLAWRVDAEGGGAVAQSIESFAASHASRRVGSNITETYGLSETIRCLIETFVSQIPDILCKMPGYIACVAGSGGTGVAGCLVVFDPNLCDLFGIGFDFGLCLGTTDATRPVVTVHQPSSSTVSGSVSVQVTATDNRRVQSVAVSVAGANRSVLVIADTGTTGGCSITNTTSATCATVWNTTLSGDGTATIQVSAWDDAGNVGQTQRTLMVANRPAGDAWDPNDDMTAGASILSAPGLAEQTHGPHTLSNTDAYDWFKVFLVAGPSYNFNTIGGTADDYAELYSDATGSTRVAFDDDGGGSLQFSLSYRPTTSGYYFLRVRAYSIGNNISYTLRYTQTTSSPGDVWDPTDNTGAGATLINAPVVTQQSHGPHALSNADLYDWFRVFLSAGVSYNFNSIGGTGDDYAELYSDAAGTTRVAFDDDGGGSFQFNVNYRPTTSAYYYLRVRAYSSGASCAYTLKYHR